MSSTEDPRAAEAPEEPAAPAETSVEQPSAAPAEASVEQPSVEQPAPSGGDLGAAEAPLAAGASAVASFPAPSFRFFGIVAAVSLVADVVTKAWAELTLNQRGFQPIEVIDDHVNIILAYNRGGAWGLLQDAPEVVRKPFFLGVSVAAILFIVSLYGRLTPSQRALRWGLPLVLGGALGNLSDRITRSQVIDFIDYRADWVMSMNELVRRYVRDWTLTDHWPTFNVADIAICVGVGLMAVDMFSARRRPQLVAEPREPLVAPTTSGTSADEGAPDDGASASQSAVGTAKEAAPDEAALAEGAPSDTSLEAQGRGVAAPPATTPSSVESGSH